MQCQNPILALMRDMITLIFIVLTVRSFLKTQFQVPFTPGEGGGGTPIYWLYWDVRLEREWFLSHLVWYRV